MKKCVFAGTFDPFTVGHEDTVKKCLALFDEVVVAVAENRKKSCMFTVEKRTEMVRAVFAGEPRVRVLMWGGAVVDLLKREQTRFYVRGVRDARDFEYENADFFASRDFDPEMIELYIPSEQPLLHVSSSLVRNCIVFGKDFARYVPGAVFRMIGGGDVPA